MALYFGRSGRSCRRRRREEKKEEEKEDKEEKEDLEGDPIIDEWLLDAGWKSDAAATSLHSGRVVIRSDAEIGFPERNRKTHAAPPPSPPPPPPPPPPAPPRLTPLFTSELNRIIQQLHLSSKSDCNRKSIPVSGKMIRFDGNRIGI